MPQPQTAGARCEIAFVTRGVELKGVALSLQKGPYGHFEVEEGFLQRALPKVLLSCFSQRRPVSSSSCHPATLITGCQPFSASSSACCCGVGAADGKGGQGNLPFPRVGRWDLQMMWPLPNEHVRLSLMPQSPRVPADVSLNPRGVPGWLVCSPVLQAGLLNPRQGV